MYQEEISMAVWATQYPYLYTVIQLKLPLSILFGSVIAKIIVGIGGKKK